MARPSIKVGRVEGEIHVGNKASVKLARPSIKVGRVKVRSMYLGNKASVKPGQAE